MYSIIEVFYHLNKMLIATKHIADNNFCLSVRQRTGSSCMQHSPNLSASLFLTYDPNSPDVISESHWLYDLESNTIAWVWVTSQQVWRNQMATAWNWQSNDTAFWVKLKWCYFWTTAFSQVVQKHYSVSQKKHPRHF